MKYVAPAGPLTIGGVLDNWLRLFRASFSSCWTLALLVAVAGALIQFTITPILPQRGAPLLQFYMQYWSAMVTPATFVPDLALGLISLVIHGAVLAQQTALVRGDAALSFGTALTKGLSRLPQMLLGGVVLVLIVAAIAIPFGIVGALTIPALRRSAMGILVSVTIVISAFIVLIYVITRLQLWMAVLFSENLGGASSVGRSWDLVKGQWWRVTGVTFVSGIVIWILSVTIAGGTSAVTSAIGIHGTTPDAHVRRVQLVAAVTQLSRLLTLPLFTAVWLAMYQDLKLRREGGDLAARTEALSGG